MATVNTTVARAGDTRVITTEDWYTTFKNATDDGDVRLTAHKPQYQRNSAQYNAAVREAVDKFLIENHVVAGDKIMNLRDDRGRDIISQESFNTELNLGRFSKTNFDNMLDAANITDPTQRNEAVRALGLLMAKCYVAGGDNNTYLRNHFSHGNRTGIDERAITRSVNTVYAPSLHGTMTTGIPSSEAFGVNIDRVQADIRSSFGVTLMQFHRGIIDRIIPRRTASSPYIRYVVPYTELYDMLKSNDADDQVRNQGDHIIPFINLYGDPKAVSNSLQLIVPLVSNDKNGVLHSDGIIRFDKKANIFSLSVLPNQLGKTHYNYTDLVSENVILDSIVVELKKDETKELFQIPLGNVNSARFNMLPNVNDSGIRAAILTYSVRLGKDTKTMSGLPSTILQDCTDTDYLRLDLHAAVSINLKYADVRGIGSAAIAAHTKNIDAEVVEAVKNLEKNVTVSLAGYSLDARYSEENLRKSNLALRYNTREFVFEISNGRNIMVDYSFEQQVPEFLMSLISEATSLGQDHRGIDVIIKELMHVFDVTNLENQDPMFRERLEKVGFEYIAAQLVRPVVYLNVIDISEVSNIRSGDLMGDIRAYVEWTLLNLISLLYQNSYYKHQLHPGSKPVFKVVTSSVILENLFSIPHYHNHLNTEEPVDGSMVEYRRVLPNGTVLDCTTCTYDYMRDKIIIIPWQQDDPESILNFGHNWDFGTFVAHYSPQLDNSVNRRLFSNSRTQVVPTCPIGIYLSVKNISQIADMNTLTNPSVNGTEVPDPNDFITTHAVGAGD